MPTLTSSWGQEVGLKGLMPCRLHQRTHRRGLWHLPQRHMAWDSTCSTCQDAELHAKACTAMC